METFQVTGESPIAGYCGDCEHMKRELMQGQLQRVMTCHCNPPSVIAVATHQGIQVQTMFPMVQKNMYCAQFKRAQKAPPDELRPLATGSVLKIPDGARLSRESEVSPASPDSLPIPDGT